MLAERISATLQEALASKGAPCHAAGGKTVLDPPTCFPFAKAPRFLMEPSDFVLPLRTEKRNLQLQRQIL